MERSSLPPMRSAGLFAADTLLRTALVTGALLDRRRPRFGYTVRSAHPYATPPSRTDRSRNGLTRSHAGAALIRASHLVGDERVQDPYSLRCQPQVMGACLDLMRSAAATCSGRPTASPTTRWCSRETMRCCRAELPRRAGGLRGRSTGPGGVRRSARSPNGASRYWSIPP